MHIIRKNGVSVARLHALICLSNLAFMYFGFDEES